MTASDLYIAVVGCGRLGSNLAGRLSRAGYSVVVIDVNEDAFSGLSPEYGGFRVEGDATELDVLRQAKLDSADIVIATTLDDNINLMVAQLAKAEFGVRRVLARVFEPSREAIFKRLGVEAICPTSVAADLFLKSVTTEGSI